MAAQKSRHIYMKVTAEFVKEHLNDETSRLILNKGKWPDVDMDIAVNSIESRRKLKGKVQEWYEDERLVFPLKLSAEQCSSSNTARYKAELAKRIAGCEGWKIADLTGGLGVDSWFYSQKAETVLYNEMQPVLCKAAEYNFRCLEAYNISISNCMIVTGKEDIIREFGPDIIYMDPARRGEGGKKVFLIEDCTPDILNLKDSLFEACRHILVKLSPMADITMACERLGKHCREVHVVATGGECKELLIWMDREWDGEYKILAVELHNDGTSDTFCFMPSEERLTTSRPAASLSLNDKPYEGYIFEPGKALMKAGAFNLTSLHFDLEKMAQSTHYYVTYSSDKVEDLKKYGKVFRIIDIQTLDKRSMKAAGRKYPHADVTARNIPMTSEMLRKKIGCSDGGPVHIFGLKSDAQGPLLLITERL